MSFLDARDTINRQITPSQAQRAADKFETDAESAARALAYVTHNVMVAAFEMRVDPISLMSAIPPATLEAGIVWALDNLDDCPLIEFAPEPEPEDLADGEDNDPLDSLRLS